MNSNKPLNSGFILPALVVFSFILMSIGLVALQYVASSTNSIQTAFYSNIAKEAANAGASFAYQCVRASNRIDTVPWSGNVLAPNYNCSGFNASSPSTNKINASITGTASDNFHKGWLNETKGPSIMRTSFEVATPSTGAANSDTNTSGTQITAIGKVEFFYAGSSTPSRTVTQTTRVNIPHDLAATTLRRAVGKAVTQMETGANTNCAIANQQLYCWGANFIGQMAQGGSDTATRATPILVNTGGLAGKRVTYASMGYTNGCAIADGRNYCWGINQRGQLGNGTAPGFLASFDIAALFTSTRHTPTKSTGPLNNANVTKVSASWTADGNADRAHTCALSNGAVYCWGSNYYGQLGQPKYEGAIDPLCAASGWVSEYILFVPSQWLCPKPQYTGMGPFDNNDYYTPTPIFGFGNRKLEDASRALLYKKRITDLDTGHFRDCAITNGTVYCWGEGDILQLRGSADPAGGLTTQSTEARKTGSLSARYATSVAAGVFTWCAVADGQLNCWGQLRGDGTVDNDDSPKTVTLPDANAVIDRVKISTEGAGPICGIGSGKSYCWGTMLPGTRSPIRVEATSPNESITDAGTGGGLNVTGGIFGSMLGVAGNSCYIANATVYCSGNNYYGQLGNGTISNTGSTTYSRTATTIGLTEGKAATDISSGGNFSCAIIDGQPFCWGANASGQLGVGDLLMRSNPTAVNGLPDAKSSSQVDAGTTHACSITSGRAYCWGNNASGQVGSGAANPQRSAHRVTGNSIENMAITDISAGRDHTCAVANGRAYCWGNNSYGQLGTGGGNTNTPTPVRINGGDALYGKQVTKIAAGDRFTCAIADGQPYCWGERASGKIGNGGSVTGNSPLPVAVSNMSGTSTDLDAGPDYACAIQAGIPYCWGENQHYQLGIGSTVDQTVPAVNATLRGAAGDPRNTTSLGLGATSACAITNGISYCWGSRTNGRIGNGGSVTGSSTTPVAVTEVDSATAYGPQNAPYQITTGGFGSCAIANARIYCWGEGSEGKMGNSTSAGSTVPTVSADYTRDVLVPSWSETVFY